MVSGLLVSILPACLIAASATDVRALRIPNWIPLVIFFLFWPVALWVGVSISVVEWSLVAALAALLVGFILFSFNLLGGGDAKLIAATTLWIGPGQLFSFLVGVTLFGALLCASMLALRAAPLTPVMARTDWLMRLREPKARVPYAVAIAGGALFVFPQTPLFVTAIGG